MPTWGEDNEGVAWEGDDVWGDNNDVCDDGGYVRGDNDDVCDDDGDGIRDYSDEDCTYDWQWFGAMIVKTFVVTITMTFVCEYSDEDCSCDCGGGLHDDNVEIWDKDGDDDDDVSVVMTPVMMAAMRLDADVCDGDNEDDGISCWYPYTQKITTKENM